MTRTFNDLVKGCTPEERDALAWFLAMRRARGLRFSHHPADRSGDDQK